jgi:nucleoside-diphosphate-sugar epimerase
MPPKVLIIGATGVIGKPITDQILAAKSSFERISILTSANTVNNKADEIKVLKEKGVDVFVGDLGVEEEVKAAYTGKSTFSDCSHRG